MFYSKNKKLISIEWYEAMIWRRWLSMGPVYTFFLSSFELLQYIAASF